MTRRDLFDLSGKVALVTGAGQGAGRGIARVLAAYGASVAVNDYLLERAETVAEEIRAEGGAAAAFQSDVGVRDSVLAMFAEANEALGPVTLLVNNAGNAGPTAGWDFAPFWETDPAGWERYFHTNLFGVMTCCHVAMPGMVAAGGGRIVTIGSDSGRVGDAMMAAYGAAKAGAAGFMRCLASEAGRHGITCNTVALGSQQPQLDAEALAAHMASERVKKQLSRYPIRRLGRPDDVAATVLFLCSDAAEWITGQTIPVNGGYSYAL